MQPIQKYIDLILSPDRSDLRAKLNPAQVKRLQEGEVSYNAQIKYIETCFPGVSISIYVDGGELDNPPAPPGAKTE